MDDLSALFGSQEQSSDLVDRLMNLLDRQTDHKLNPAALLGFMGMFNLLTIMSVVRGNMETGLKEVGSQTQNGDSKKNEQSVMSGLSSLLQSGSGQPDLMGLLSSIASKKKINPSLLLSLFSMLNNQANQTQPETSQTTNETLVTAPAEKSSSGVEEGEKKSPDKKHEVELKYDKKRG